MRCSQLERVVCALAVVALAAALIVHSSTVRPPVDIGVPGYDMRSYSNELTEMAKEYPRQWTHQNDLQLKKIYYPLEWLVPFLQSEKEVFPDWITSAKQLVASIPQWDNVFYIRYAEGEVTEFTPPSAEAFLATEEPQPFVVFLDVAGSDALPAVAKAWPDLSGSDGIRVRMDPARPGLVRVQASGIRVGESTHPFTLIGLKGDTLFKTEFAMRGINPGRIKVNIVDEKTGEPTAALVSIVSTHGRECPPNATPFYVHEHTELWRINPGGKNLDGDSRMSVIPGPFEMPIYPGKCRIAVLKGPEHRTLVEEFEVAPGAVVEKTLTPQRYVNLRERGWYSGDDHCHIGRNPARDPDILELLSALDLGVTNIAQAGDDYRVYFVQSAWGETSREEKNGHLMVAGQEDPRTSWRGHTLMYNIQNSIHNREGYYVYEDAFKEARRQGGLNGYAHSCWAFNARLGAAVSVPLQLVDFIELDTADGFAREALYHFWNMGFKLAAASGSDFPWGAVPGTPRFYTYVDGEFTFEKYMKSLQAGHTFTSRGGAFIDIRANGKLPGDIIQASAGEEIKVTFQATINPEFDALDRVEIVRNGEVVQEIKPTEGAQAWLDHQTTIRADESCWVAARVFGEFSNPRQAYGAFHRSSAHTTPFFVEVDGKPAVNAAALAGELAEARKTLDALEEIIENGDPSVDPILMGRQRQRLSQYVKEAREVYAKLEEAN